MNGTYNNTKELRYWCQKVLPLVYDDSLSYYELLNKIVVYLNSTIEDVQAMIADVTRIEQGLSSKIDLSQKGVANGVATLNGNGQVPLSQLPDISAGVQTISVNDVNIPADANKNVNIIVMTNAVSNLVNYYLKSETYNKAEVNALIDSVKNSRFKVVAQLPTTDIQTNVIYLVPKSIGQTQNGYDEFINLNGTTSGWELIGSTDIDLSGYVTDNELATALSAYVTTQSLNTTLASYVTSGALATTLQGYVTNATFETLSGTVASQGNTIAGLVTAVNGKVDKVTGKGLSTNDYTNTDKDIVDGVTSALAEKFPRSEQKVLAAKNIFDKKQLQANGTTITQTENGFKIVSTSAGTWRSAIWNFANTFKNTEWRIKTTANITAGKALISVRGSNDLTNWTSIKDSATLSQSGNIDITFNTGSYAYIRVQYFCTAGTSESGDVTYVDTMCYLATDPDDTYADYAMTNKELTENVIDNLINKTICSDGDHLSTAFDLNNLNTVGVFYTNITIENVSNAPTGILYGGGMKIIITQIDASANRKMQLLFTRAGEIFVRMRENSTSWKKWLKFSTVELS